MLPSLGEITSPNEWPESLQEMRNIDNLLRCSICKEFFDVAMMIQDCSHNYCSLCIRQSINHKTQCPTCSVKVSGNDLKSNRVLDEIVLNFVKMSCFFVGGSLQGQEAHHKKGYAETRYLLQLWKLFFHRSKLIALLANKTVIQEDRKNEILSDDSDNIFEKTPSGKNFRRRKKQGKGKSPKINATPRNKRKRQKIIESDSDDEETYQPVNASIKKESSASAAKPGLSTLPTDNVSGNASSSSANQLETASSFVECPVCGDMISDQTINSHLDSCLTREEKKSSLRSKTTSTPEAKPASSETAASSTTSSTLSPASESSLSTQNKPSISGANVFISNKPKRKTIPQLVYTLLSDKQLKKKLSEFKLSTQGTRQAMIKRYQEFVTIYNAQCDAKNPKTASVIAKEIEIRERSKKFNTTTDSVLHSLNKDSSSEEVEKARQAYLEKHDDHFQQLFNNMKRRKKKQASSPTKAKSTATDNNINDDSEDIQEIPLDKSIAKEKHASPSQKNKANTVVEDPVAMDTSDSETKPDDNKAEESTSNKSQDTHTISENARCNEDILMEDSEQAETVTRDDKSVPEPPSPSSLVLLNDSDNESISKKDGDRCLDSSPSLGLSSDDEKRELKNDSDSDSDLFKTEVTRTPTHVNAKSLRTRKR